MHIRMGIIAILALSVPALSLAHETHVYEINGESYTFVVGSINEPIVVDDKTGVELRVSKTNASGGHDSSEGAVEGLQDSLKVELQAGDARTVLPVSALYGTPGAYRAPYFPTVATTITYRIFGTIDDTPVDVSFTCAQSGHAQATEDTSRTPVSDNVVRVLKTGSFGCPLPKKDLGFPEPSVELRHVQGGGERDYLSYGAGALALAALGIALMRRRP